MLGFPCNQFGGQEPGTAEEIAEFCSLNFGVTFPLMAKVEVNGRRTLPLYELAQERSARADGHQVDQMEFHQVPDRPRRQSGAPLRPDRQARGLAKDIEKLL